MAGGPTFSTRQITIYEGVYHDADNGITITLYGKQIQVAFDASGRSIALTLADLPKLVPVLVKVLNYAQANYPDMLLP